MNVKNSPPIDCDYNLLILVINSIILFLLYVHPVTQYKPFYFMIVINHLSQNFPYSTKLKAQFEVKTAGG